MAAYGKKRWFALLVAALLLLPGAWLFSLSPSAADSGDYSTASRIDRAVRDLSSSPSWPEVDALARAVRSLSRSEQKRLNDDTIRTLGGHYNKWYTERVRVYTSGFSSGNRMPNDSFSYGAAMSAGGAVTIDLDQRDASGSTELQFYASSDTGIHGPFILWVALPDNFKNSYDYYIKGNDGRLDVDIRRVSNQRYAVFTAYSTGTYKLVRKSSSGNRYDDDYEVSSFWEDVIDDISSARRDDVIRVNVGSRTTMPADVLRELKGTHAFLILRRNNGATITIDADDVDYVPSSKDYYTMSSLQNMFDASSRRSSSSKASSIRPVPPPCPPDPCVSSPPVSSVPQWTAPAWRPTPSAAASSSTAPSSSSEDSSDQGLPDIIEPEDDNGVVAEEEPESSEPEEKPAAVQAQPSKELLFLTVGTVVLAVLATGILTMAIFIAKKRR